MQVIIKTKIDGEVNETVIFNVISIEQASGITYGLVKIKYIGKNGKVKEESAMLNGYTELILR